MEQFSHGKKVESLSKMVTVQAESMHKKDARIVGQDSLLREVLRSKYISGRLAKRIKKALERK